MPEYLAPGVYVEEVSFRSKSIEGVPTSTTGFAGLAHYGPVQYLDGPRATEPRLVTSYAEFERVYGGLDPLGDGLSQRLPYLAHGARAFSSTEEAASTSRGSTTLQPQATMAWRRLTSLSPHLRRRWPGSGRAGQGLTATSWSR